ncbi:MAG TPA: peroxidase-related enzyme [Ohtaekwangia sp.]|uniref:carboxymuconolactone decarboxylase family protein n=1 Tax=Ohtaekwangia sp. TaxID=2066019 RepID=UPI002F9421C7
MAHIQLPEGLPGIRGPMAFRPETSKPLNELAEVLLRSDNSLSRGDRELIATYVSYLNDCFFCQNAHGGLTQHYLGWDIDQLDKIKSNPEAAPISDKLKALLAIAASVQKGGKQVTADQIERARNADATDIEIHDTVLIAAAFCMFNRYVDGLATWAPADRMFYVNRAKARAEEGYANYNPYH